MELDNVATFLRDKTILVTGATRFLAKGTELFRTVRESWGSKFDYIISRKVIAVPGDISCQDLGVKNSKLGQEMLKEIELVVNFAATTNFYERYDVALDTNTFGAFNVLSFAQKCDKVKLFLHVSTAYVCGEKEGLVSEKGFYMGETLKKTCKLDIAEEKRMVEENLDQLRSVPDEAVKSAMKEFGFQRAKLYGWPNIYVFTKAMGEMLLGNFKGDLPLVVIRPSMITSTYKEPFPGWIEGARTIDAVIVNYGKGKLTCFPGNPDCALDVIPVDMVVNAMVVAMVVHTNHQYNWEPIYHVSSSLKNPITLSDLHKFLICYFNKNPWIDRNGQRVKIGKTTVFSRADTFFLYMKVKYVLPVKVLRLVNILCCQYFKKYYEGLDRKIKFVMRLAQLYQPYVFFKGTFGDTNLEKLRTVGKDRGIDMGEFNFDSKSIEWEDYIMNIHIPGLSTDVMKS